MKERIGGAAWVVGVIQFLALQVVVASAWSRPYSWARNNISNLGNVHCLPQQEPEPRYICSPDHDLMNAAFVTVGILLIVGAVLIGQRLWRRSVSAGAARVLLAVGGSGFVLAGLAPADLNENLHVLGALLIMTGGNGGLVVAGFGLAPHIPAALRWGTSIIGVVALAAFWLFISGAYLGLGMGGMERLAALPLLCWALVAGLVAARRPS